jgi:hypothetical protein
MQNLCDHARRIRGAKFTHADTCNLSDYLWNLYTAVDQLEYPEYSFRYMYAMRQYIEQSRRAVIVARLYLMNNGCPIERLAEYDAWLHYIINNYPPT